MSSAGQSANIKRPDYEVSRGSVGLGVLNAPSDLPGLVCDGPSEQERGEDLS